jgi:hypothetical protein
MPLYLRIFTWAVFVLGVILMFAFKPSSLGSVQLKTLSGQVTGLQSQVKEYVDHDPHDSLLRFTPLRRVYLATFQLDGRPLEARFQGPYRIAEGDRITVSGFGLSGKAFEILAYRNHTQNYRGSDNWIVACLVGLAFAIAALFMQMKLMSAESIIAQVMMVVFVLTGLYIVYRGLLIREAIELLK